MNPENQSTLLDSPFIEMQYQNASKTLRLIHFLVDGFIMMDVFFILGVFLIKVRISYKVIMLLETPFLSAVVYYFLYYFIVESIFRTSPAKMITGTMLIDEVGNKPSIRKIFIRSLGRIIPFEPFSFFGEQGWHDAISKTRVVKR